MIASCHAAAAQGRRRPPPLASVVDTARVAMASVDPNRTPTGDPRIGGLKIQPTPDQNRAWRKAMGTLAPTELSFGFTPDEMLAKYFQENGAKVVDGLQRSTAPGANHGISGNIKIEIDMFGHNLFVIERTGESQRKQLLYGNGNSFDAGHKLESLTDRLHAAYQQLDKGIVALIDRLRITSDDDAEPKYLELYPAVEGHNCYQSLEADIGKTECTVNMIELCGAIGRKVKEMEDAGAPHEDCHLGNFLSLGKSQPVFAIDFRRIAEAQSDPFSNFTKKLLTTFTKRIKNLSDELLIETCAEQYVACIQAFLDQATTDLDVVPRVLTDLRMTCAGLCESEKLISFYSSLLVKFKRIYGE